MCNVGTRVETTLHTSADLRSQAGNVNTIRLVTHIQISGIRYQVSYLDWGTFSRRLFLQAPSKQKGKEKSTKQRQRSVKCESIGSSIVSQSCSIKIN